MIFWSAFYHVCYFLILPEATVAIKDMYKNRIKLADQDILNILFR